MTDVKQAYEKLKAAAVNLDEDLTLTADECLSLATYINSLSWMVNELTKKPKAAEKTIKASQYIAQTLHSIIGE